MMPGLVIVDLLSKGAPLQLFNSIELSQGQAQDG
jgi:hypothetical protein